jgi:hypothetical protein
MEARFYIYYLADKEKWCPIYVGCTKDPDARFGVHSTNIKRTKANLELYNFIREYKIDVGMCVVDSKVFNLTVPYQVTQLDEWENYWIEQIRSWGYPILNKSRTNYSASVTAIRNRAKQP